MSKTVYILGAGFSVMANLPPQAAILERIFDSDSVDLFALGDRYLLQTEGRYKEAKRNIAEFILQFFTNKKIYSFLSQETLESTSREELVTLTSSLRDNPQYYERIFQFIKNNKSYINLEDIFTILDKAYISNEHIQGYDLQRIIQLREDFILCIIRLFALANSTLRCDNPFYIQFIKNLVEERIHSGQEGDPFSIITLNWDGVFDRYFNHIVEQDYSHLNLRLDYCVYDHNFDFYFSSQKHDNIPSTLLKKLGYYNIKFLKLHGAMNWLLCKNCQRLYYSYNYYIALLEFLDANSPTCPYCRENYGTLGYSNQIKLKCELITPTLLKNLDNVTFKSIWKNAFVELSEAQRVVFIGYSLPQADFELRYLLKKAIKPDTKIEVVLYHDDDPQRLRNNIQEGSSLYHKIVDYLPERRYISFFGNENIEFNYEGLQDFVSKMSQ